MPAKDDNSVTTPVGSIFNWPVDKPVHEAIGEAIGYASMCWNPIPTGVFDPTRAAAVARELEELLRRKMWTDG